MLTRTNYWPELTVNSVKVASSALGEQRYSGRCRALLNQPPTVTGLPDSDHQQAVIIKPLTAPH